MCVFSFSPSLAPALTPPWAGNFAHPSIFMCVLWLRAPTWGIYVRYALRWAIKEQLTITRAVFPMRLWLFCLREEDKRSPPPFASTDRHIRTSNYFYTVDNTLAITQGRQSKMASNCIAIVPYYSPLLYFQRAIENVQRIETALRQHKM